MIEMEKREGLAVITLNNPEKRNRLSRQAMIDLKEAFIRADRDPEVRVVVVTGAGDKAFCAGADLSEFAGSGIVHHRRQNEAYRRLCLALYEMGKPVVARVNGVAVAGGMAMVALAHLVVASDKAVFGTPEINVGAFPNMVMTGILRGIQRKAANKMILLGEFIDAGEALAVGLVNAVVPFERLDETVDELAGKLAAKSPAAMRLGLDSIRVSSDLPFPQALEYLQEVATLIRGTEDCQEGARAFLEKRKPHWKGE